MTTKTIIVSYSAKNKKAAILKAMIKSKYRTRHKRRLRSLKAITELFKMPLIEIKLDEKSVFKDNLFLAYTNRVVIEIPPELQIMTYRGNQCTVKEAVLKAYKDGLSCECIIDLLETLKVCETFLQTTNLVYTILTGVVKDGSKNVR